MTEEKGVDSSHALHRGMVRRIFNALVIFELGMIDRYQKPANFWDHATLSCQSIILNAIVDQTFKK